MKSPNVRDTDRIDGFLFPEVFNRAVEPGPEVVQIRLCDLPRLAFLLEVMVYILFETDVAGDAQERPVPL